MENNECEGKTFSNEEIDKNYKINQKTDELKPNCKNLNLNGLTDSQSLALRQTTFNSIYSSMSDGIGDNLSKSKQLNESNSIIHNSLVNKKESINPENSSSSSLKKEAKEGDFLNNIKSVQTTIYEETDEEKKEEDQKKNKESYKYNPQEKNIFFPNKIDYNKMPLFFGDNKPKPIIQNIPLNPDPLKAITRKYILSCFCDQESTKFLQNWINSSCPKEYIVKIVKELTGSYSNIIKNKNGNYFCCDLFKNCEQKERLLVLKELSTTLSIDCLDKFGTHPIQILVEYSANEEEYNLILLSFNDYNNSLIACLNPNGAYVVQKIIKHIPEKNRMKFNLIFISFLSFITGKKYGVVNAKLFIDKTKNEELMQHIVSQIKANFFAIATNQFGNFFIQHLLEKWNNTNEGAIIKKEIITNFRALFENKYASYICDLFLKISNIEEKRDLMNLLQLNLLNNNSNRTDKLIMIKIMKSFEQNFGDKNKKNNDNKQNNSSNQSRFNMNEFNNFNNNGSSVNNNNQMNNFQFHKK